MLKKNIYKVILVLVIFLFFIINLDTIRAFVVKRLNQDQKQFITEIFFGKGEAERFKQYKIFGKMSYNQNILPSTQFVKIDFFEKSLEELDLTESISKWNPGSVQFYLDNYNDKVILADSFGNFYFIDNQSFEKNSKINFEKIKTNFKFNNKVGAIRDLLVHDNKIYVSYSDFNNECTKINISMAQINSNLNFEKLFTSSDCNLEFDAGRISNFRHNGKDGLLITTDTDLKGTGAQNVDSSFGKILFIDFKTKKSIIYSMGHRTPQGLYATDEIVLSAEHGPRGGDEINKIIFGGNYGWPISSYGEPYFHQKFYKDEDSKNKFFYKKNHKSENFIEPVYAFVPSIGINQIIKVPSKFSYFWENNFLVTSLNGRSIFRANLNHDYNKIISMEKIFIGKRIRDIIYNDKNNIFLLALEGKKFAKSSDGIPSIGILKVSKD